ncbi:root hair defective 3 GTP-binding protein-domain-containing protein [Thamnocephalis sphaerospora]|uniref:Root hair defective 3 GTP-binding protein-domain-containing protein n=1 Tax=Thamnocephalis sphaerospora TaxID=78915 RepID=A0A4P9XQ36_9FUNG|nr:root hair defective 3 GTP-binding protein-domain-containing protein [Thamnocephalis sphaerospora]|eukprot:RKP08012.1 root hair defective 3 GTP-binding protein-domain-containing protein [Thamnocephalis sphaerospora]
MTVYDGENTGCVQIIDDEHDPIEDIQECIDQAWDLHDWGTDYNIVTIGGPQGSGQSTLLNALFGTKFFIPDDNDDESTTEGVWMSVAPGMNVLAMDAEMVGSSDGVGWKCWLFTTTHKTLLLFAIRDHTGELSQEHLFSELMSSISEAWSNLEKPSGLDMHAACDFFDCEVVTLPSKLNAPDEFDAAVSKLRTRFVDKHSQDYVFKPHYWKLVNADKIAVHFAAILDTISDHWTMLNHKVLSQGPTPQPAKAKKYSDARRSCLFQGQYEEHIRGFYDMATHHAYSAFVQAIGLLRQSTGARIIDEQLALLIRRHYRDAMDTFNAITCQHRHADYGTNRDGLREKCYAAVTSLFPGQLPWDMANVDTQICIERALEQQESLIQERVRRDVKHYLTKMELIISQQATEISTQAAKISEQAAKIKEQKAGMAAQKKTIDRQHATISALDTEISNLEKVIDVQDSNLVTQNEMANGQKDIIKKQKCRINALMAQIAEREAEIAKMGNQVAELSAAMAFIIKAQQMEQSE